MDRVPMGIILPQNQIGPDPADVRAFVAAAESAGFSYLQVYDHVLGADTTNRQLSGPYGLHDQFHEVLVTLGWIAGFSSLELMTGVLVLPQRQTALVAKQAAQVDVLSGGRFILGVGIGWNHVEFTALGMSFRDRAARYEEQIEVLRALWTNESVDYTGRWHRIEAAGILPRPVQQPIPVWIGSGTGAIPLRRAGRIADGWISNVTVDNGFAEAGRAVRQAAADAGRDPASIGLQARVDVRLRELADEPTVVLDVARRQRDRLVADGATRVSVQLLGGPRPPAEFIEAVARLAPLCEPAG
ncbi:MAG: LLM class F420-dependent oxidoreductase [Frankia sp.]|nr:LLM class F420-dependent oxidoreductase [Frankia sp.]